MPTTELDLTWDEVRAAINQHAANEHEWAGAPMPVSGLRLTVEKKYPWQGLNGCGFNLEEDGEPPSNLTLRNSWFSKHHQAVVHIFEEDGKLQWGMLPANHTVRHAYALQALGAVATAWSIEAEHRAQEKLLGLVGEWKFKCYTLTGMFLETSKRSGVTYLFRRLRPTLALRPDPETDMMRMLCALCLHPIGYYQETFAGVMVPTDCVIAHVTLMRGDESHYWKSSNQHPAWVPEAGL